MSPPEINVGLLVMHSPEFDAARLSAFAADVAAAVERELREASGACWRLHREEPFRLHGDEPRRPSDFLDEASLSMAEGPFDMVVVVTDVGLVSRRSRLLPGVASPIARLAVLSTRRLSLTGRDERDRPLEDPALRANAAALLLHLIGHLAGLEHTRAAGDVMAPFEFLPDRRDASFGAGSREALAVRSARMPEREHRSHGALGTLWFHVVSALRHPAQTLRPLVRNRAPMLPLSLPGLATAAVTPTFILVFTAEIWDVGLNLPGPQTWISAAVTILAATIYLTFVQNLFFPRRERRVVPEHMAVVNTSIFLTMLLAVCGLFVMLGLLMLLIQTYVFPPGLISTWPTLQDPVVDLSDKLRLAGFISTVGVITGALAGGLEKRNVIRHLALFQDEP